MSVPDSGFINPAQLVSHETYNGLAPQKKPRAVRLPFDFAAANPLNVDLEYIGLRDVLEFVQSIYIDNADNPNSVSFTFAISNQRITAPPNSQGYYSVLAPGASSVLASTSLDYTGLVTMYLLSFPVAAVVWKTA